MKTKVFRLGLDWITYLFDIGYVDAFLESLFLNFSETANQQFDISFFGRQFDITYTDTKTKRILLFHYLDTAVFELVKNQTTKSKRRLGYKFSFYGAYFYIDDLSEILLEFTRQYRGRMHISRLDIALDTDVPIPVLYRRKHTQFIKEKLFKTNGILTGFYLGSREGNRKHFIRVYDKKLDSGKKGKFHLFLPYLAEDIVSRVEVEMHVLTLKTLRITPQTVIDYEEARLTGFEGVPNCVEQYFASLCMKKGGTYFYPLKGVSFSKVERLNTATFTGLSDEIQDQILYIKQFVGRAKSLKRMGIDPIALLHRRFPPPPLSSLNQQDSLNLPY